MISESSAMPVQNEGVSTQFSNVLKHEKQQSGQRYPSSICSHRKTSKNSTDVLKNTFMWMTTYSHDTAVGEYSQNYPSKISLLFQLFVCEYSLHPTLFVLILSRYCLFYSLRNCSRWFSERAVQNDVNGFKPFYKPVWPVHWKGRIDWNDNSQMIVIADSFNRNMGHT